MSAEPNASRTTPIENTHCCAPSPYSLIVRRRCEGVCHAVCRSRTSTTRAPNTISSAPIMADRIRTLALLSADEGRRPHSMLPDKSMCPLDGGPRHE